MDFDIRPEPDDDLVVIRVTGTIDLAAIAAFLPSVSGHPGFRPGMGTLWDFRDARVGDFDSQQLRRLGEINRTLADARGRGRSAHLVSDDLAFGLGRMHEVIGATPHLEMRTFRDEREARRWLAGGSGSRSTD